MTQLDDLEDVRYAVRDGVAWLTIDRPDRANSLCGRTVDELIRALKTAWADRTVGVVVLTGSGSRFFCTGGDQKQRLETGDYGPSEFFFDIEGLHRAIREIPKPVVAAVNGAAIGGGHVLHVLCDITIAADTATFGQAGPRVGSFDGGWGITYLARVVGEKRAREIWFFCRQYDAATMERWGLVNAVVPADRLAEEAQMWAAELLAKSPTALRFLKAALSTQTEGIAGTAMLANAGLDQFVVSEEGREGVQAFNERRPPDFLRYRTATAVGD